MTGDGIRPTDSEGAPWLFAAMPWVGVIDEKGRAQKVPVRKDWQLTEPGQWQVPDTYTDPDMPGEEDPTGMKLRIRPGTGAWPEGWEEGWVCNQRTGLWVPDIDNLRAFRARMEELGIEVPPTYSHSTGREGGGMHLLLDGRDLPEWCWQQGPLGDPCWGDLKCNGFIAATGARHPRGPRYTGIPDSGLILVKPTLEFAEVILAERERYRKAEGQNSAGGGATGRRNVFSMTGENRNVRLTSLRGALLNRVPEMDDEEIREALIAANEQFAEPMTMREIESTVLRPKPGWVRHPVSRHAPVPRLRVAPPAELARYADQVIRDTLAPVREAAGPAWPDDPQDEDASWGDMSPAMDLVKPAAEVFGGLGDTDLLDFEAASAIIRSDVLPAEYTGTMSEDERAGLDQRFAAHFLAGWNKGARDGHEVPAHLQDALDEWHPRCSIPRESIEAHRLPPGREGRWPVQDFVSRADDRGNARRLADHFGDRIRFDDADLKAYAFDGERWLDVKSGGQGLAGEFADKTIGALAVTEAMSLSVAVRYIDKKTGTPVSDRGRFWEHLNAQQSDAKRTAMIRCAATMENMRVSSSEFDADTQWLNTRSGELDLGRPEPGDDGTWRIAEPVVHHPGRHYPEHYCSRITAVPYDPSATCPAWEQALRDWLGDDAELIAYLGKLVAASVRGLVTLKVIVVLLGGGDSGKSTFLEVIMSVLGSYAALASGAPVRRARG